MARKKPWCAMLTAVTLLFGAQPAHSTLVEGTFSGDFFVPTGYVSLLGTILYDDSVIPVCESAPVTGGNARCTASNFISQISVTIDGTPIDTLFATSSSYYGEIFFDGQAPLNWFTGPSFSIWAYAGAGVNVGDQWFNRVDGPPVGWQSWGESGCCAYLTGSSGLVWQRVLLDGQLFSVPEPSTLALFGLGLLGLSFGRRKLH